MAEEYRELYCLLSQKTSAESIRYIQAIEAADEFSVPSICMHVQNEMKQKHNKSLVIIPFSVAVQFSKGLLIMSCVHQAAFSFLSIPELWRSSKAKACSTYDWCKVFLLSAQGLFFGCSH